MLVDGRQERERGEERGKGKRKRRHEGGKDKNRLSGRTKGQNGAFLSYFKAMC